MGNKRVRKCLVRALAYCHDCNWEEDDEQIAQKEGRKHAIRTGHYVTVETGYAQTYNLKEDG